VHVDKDGGYIDCLDCNTAVVVAETFDTIQKWLGFDGFEVEVSIYGDSKNPADITLSSNDTVLVSVESDGEFQCPKCGEYFNGMEGKERAYITDHNMCSDCLQNKGE